jgi:hypothetical protein
MQARAIAAFGGISWKTARFLQVWVENVTTVRANEGFTGARSLGIRPVV